MSSEKQGADSPDQEVSISKFNLEWLTQQVKDFNQYKLDAEKDIGYLAEAVYNLQNISDPMKLVGKLLAGRLDVKGLGLDTDRMRQIAAKYAPVTYARLEEKEKQSQTKK
jgi:hypothetical protein